MHNCAGKNASHGMTISLCSMRHRPPSEANLGRNETKGSQATNVDGMEEGVDVVPWNRFPSDSSIKTPCHTLATHCHHIYFQASFIMRRMYTSMSATRSGWAWATTSIYSGILRPDSSSSPLYWRITLEHKRCCKASVCITRISVARTAASALYLFVQ